MREILFRAKDLDNNWVAGDYVSIPGREDLCGIRPRSRQIINVSKLCKSATIGQYTGLTDKNGKKIFEGDILSAYFDEDYPENETRAVVVWHGIGFYLCYMSRIFELFETTDATFFEVIGNIYDNPELLEVSE